jgi:hypothetical protein
MKRKMRSICALLVIAIGAVSVFPADLRNEDSKRYEVKVYDGGTTRNSWIDGNSTIASICSSCEIEVVGVGRMKISGSDKISIKGGKLTNQ